ncbi:MAG: hypothetical protein ACREPD_05045 [Stenotrophomonas sp.]|uniref:hypothetical protein n=1 Tax=Stenotrophomonas sp. TaxID=69392 RepID=UPI003D6D0B1A
MSNCGLILGVAGYYKIEAFRADADGNEIPGSRRVAADWFPNLITNAGLNACLANNTTDFIQTCQVGSGSTTPAFTDTALVAMVASSSTEQAHLVGFSSSAPYYGWRRLTVRFATGVAAGNLSEVGMFGGSLMYSRALIVDGGGSPTTITVLSDEILDVTYEVRSYVPTADAVFTVGGYTFTVRAAGAGSVAWCGQSPSAGDIAKGWRTMAYYSYPATSTIGAITGKPSGASGTVVNLIDVWTGTPSGGSNTFRVSLSVAQGNVTGGIGAFTIGDGGAGIDCGWMFQVGCSPVLPKDATKTMKLDFTLTVARVTP